MAPLPEEASAAAEPEQDPVILQNEELEGLKAGLEAVRNREQSPQEKVAWWLLRRAVVIYCGSVVGTVAANDPSAANHMLNYDQVFIRDLVPSAIALLLKGESDIVKNFLLHTLQLQCLYLFSLFFAVLAFVIFMLFSFVAVGVSTKDEPAREYKLSDYGGWLRGRLADTQYWATVSACLRDRHACEGMKHLVRDPDTSLLVPQNADLSPIQSGCCKPPSSCAFTYVNGTMWTTTQSAPAVVTNDVDCNRWHDDQQMLCFQCNSCKAGVLEDIKKAWSKLAIPYIPFVMFPLVFVYPFEVMDYME